MTFIDRIFTATLVVYILFMNNSFATPTWVYRIDARPPTEIFPSGFTAWGNNDSVQQHVSGATGGGTAPGSRTDAFIATTEDRNYAERLATTLFFSNVRNQNGPGVYLYRIRPSNNFYSANRSVQHAMRNGRTTAIRESAIDNDLRYHDQVEFMALRDIPTEQIIDAVHYTWDRRTLTPAPSAPHANEAYVEAAPVVNDSIYPYLGTTNAGLLDHAYMCAHDVLFSCAFCPGSAPRSKRSDLFSTQAAADYTCDKPHRTTLKMRIYDFPIANYLLID